MLAVLSMSESHRLRRLPRRGSRPEPPLFETGDYTIPDPPEPRMLLTPIEDVFMPSDYDDGESTTVTRDGWR